MTSAGETLATSMTLDQCWAISETWYAGRLGLDYQRPPLDYFSDFYRGLGSSVRHGHCGLQVLGNSIQHPLGDLAQDPISPSGRNRRPFRSWLRALGLVQGDRF